MLATGVSHHFTRGRIGNEFGADAQRVASRWLSSTVMPAGFLSPRDGQTALPRLMAKRSRDGYVTSLTPVVAAKVARPVATLQKIVHRRKVAAFQRHIQ